MLKNLILSFVIFICCNKVACYADEVDKALIEKFVNSVRKNDPHEISTFVDYPIKRNYPLPPINNAQDFIDRYDEIFDDKLKNMIIQSNIDTDWHAVGWRGIMLKEGILWLTYDGQLYVINYSSQKESDHYNNIISKQKKEIYPALSDFKTNEGIYETSTYRFRIDQLEDKHYRYASWKKDKLMSTKPDMVIHNCQHEFQGTGGDNEYICQNGDYYYVISHNVITGTPPYALTVYKVNKNYTSEEQLDSSENARQILNQNAELINTAI